MEAGLKVCFEPDGIQEKRWNGIVLRPVTPALPHVESQLGIAYKPQPCELVSLFVAVEREIMTAPRPRTTRGGLPAA